LRQYWVAPLSPLHTADGTALANSTTLTDISPSPTIVLPANLLEVGSLVRLKAWGRFSTTGTPTLLIGAYYGGVAGTAICATSALTSISGATNTTWRLEGEFRVRAVGSSGSVIGAATVYGVTATTAMAMAPATAPATITADTTAAKALTIGAQWGTASASNTITCHHFDVEMVV